MSTVLTPFEQAQVRVHQTAARLAISQEAVALVQDSDRFMEAAKEAFHSGKLSEAAQLVALAREANGMLNALAAALDEQGVSA